MFREFRAFIERGNVMDLAVAVIIGAAFGKIVTSLTDDVLMPMIGRIFGGLDFSGYFIRMGDVPASYRGSMTDYAALKKAGVPLLGYGQFITQLVDFLIIAFIVFLLVRAVGRARTLVEGRTIVAVKADSAEVTLLREIRDELKGRSSL